MVKFSWLFSEMFFVIDDCEKEAAVIMAGSFKIYLLDLVELKREVNTNGFFILCSLH